jgi:chromosome segregation ATPase
MQLHASLQHLHETLKSTSEELQSKKVVLTKKTDRITKLRGEKKSLELRLEGANNLAEKITGEKAVVKAENDGLVAERNGLRAERDRLNTDIAELRIERDCLQTESSELRSERDELRRDRDCLQKAKEDWTSEKGQKDELISQMEEAGSTLERGRLAWLAKEKELNESLDSSKKSANKLRRRKERAGKVGSSMVLDEEKRAWQQQRPILEGSVTRWKDAAEALGREKIEWNCTKARMESVTSSLLEILFQAQQAWDEEKNVFKLHLEGAGNAAMQNWNMCAILVAQNGLQAG